MSIRIMLRRCQYCGYRYSYNPSMGKFGTFCPRCKKPQLDTIPDMHGKTKK